MRYPRHRMTIKSPRLAPVPVRPPGKKKKKRRTTDARKAALNERRSSFKEDERIVQGAGSATGTNDALLGRIKERLPELKAFAGLKAGTVVCSALV